jgi:conflict system STAND superfamily ATPase
VSSSKEPFADRRLRIAADELRTWNGVAIIGAGVSIMAGLPLTRHLDPLLWQAIDSDAEALMRLGERLGCKPTPAKEMIDNDEHARRLAFEIVSANPKAREVFQQGFSLLNRERARAHSRAHDALARLLHRRCLEAIVSLNWDTLLEASYRRLYGTALVVDNSWLWKPHGDAAHPERRWVLPHERAVVPAELLAQMNSLTADRPRTLLIVGYSELDEVIVRQIIKPLARGWRVVRVGPDTTGEFDIPLPADEALPELLWRVNPRKEVPGWEYVSFEPQADLGPALLGRRLGPNEVEVCPRLPEVDKVKHLLELAHSAILIGGSGSGKSITAYQAAYDLSKSGFEPIRRVDSEEDPDEILASLRNLPRPTVTIIDDAQAVDSGLIHRLLEKATAHLKVLIVSTLDYSFQRGSVSLQGQRAVKVLAEHLLRRRQETLEIVRAFDDQVGDGYTKVRIEDRIEDAAKSDTPWQFSFILTGGWRRARDLVGDIRRYERADHLLAAVAVYQLLSQDAGATLAQLTSSAHLLGHDPEWMSRALVILQKHRLIIDAEHPRCPHARFVSVVLQVVFDSALPEELEALIGLVRTAMLAKDQSLRGINWLLQEFRFSDKFHWYRHNGVVNDRVFRHLADRCWAASTGEDRGAAASLLENLEYWHPGGFAEIKAHAEVVGHWLEEIVPESAEGLERLLNDLCHKAKEVTETICGHANPRQVANRIAMVNVKDGYVWGRLLQILAQSASPTWIDELRGILPYAMFLGLAEKVKSEDLIYVGALAEGIMCFRQGISLEMIERISPNIAEGINLEPAETFGDLSRVFWFVLGYWPRLLAPRTPSRQQRATARAITRRLRPEQIAGALARTSKRDIQNFARLLEVLWEVAPSKARAIVQSVDIEALSENTRGLWENPGHELEHLLVMLAQSSDQQPAREIIERHALEIRGVTPVLALIAPDTAVARLRDGLPLHLKVEHGFQWFLAAKVLYEIWKIDRDLAIEVICHNASVIAQGLELRQSNQCEDLDIFILTLREIAPEKLPSVLSGLDTGTAEVYWSARLRGGKVERRSVAVLIAAASQGTGAIADVALRLQQRFPTIPRLARRAEEQPPKRRPRRRKRTKRPVATNVETSDISSKRSVSREPLSST